MSFYVYSTITCDTIYAIYRPTDPKSLPVIERKILIKGGNMIAQDNLFTPQGVVTEVSNEDMEALENDPNFNRHRDRGFLRVEKREVAVKKVVKDMTPKDGSAPKVPGDFKSKGKDGDGDSNI